MRTICQPGVPPTTTMRVTAGTVAGGLNPSEPPDGGTTRAKAAGGGGQAEDGNSQPGQGGDGAADAWDAVHDGLLLDVRARSGSVWAAR